MKVLVAVRSSNNAKGIVHQTLSWLPRLGFAFYLFIPDMEQLDAYYGAVDDANYHHYVGLQYGCVVAGEDPAKLARENGFDLLVLVPEALKRWRKTDSQDGTVLHAAQDIGKARVKFAKDPNKKMMKFSNGAKIIRL